MIYSIWYSVCGICLGQKIGRNAYQRHFEVCCKESEREREIYIHTDTHIYRYIGAVKGVIGRETMVILTLKVRISRTSPGPQGREVTD